MTAELSAQVVLVTGARQGIGAATCLAFANAGAHVAALVRSADQLSAGDGIELVVGADVSVEGEVAAAVAECLRVFGRIDVVVNAAGVAASAKFSDTDAALWRRLMSTDLDGPYHVIRACLPSMLERGSGRVINIASTAGLGGAAYIAAYAAAKHGLVGLTRSLAAEYARAGLTFNCVCPGYVDTPMTDATVANIMKRTGRSREEALAPLLNAQGRLVSPVEVAAACVWLAGPAAASVNGREIVLG